MVNNSRIRDTIVLSIVPLSEWIEMPDQLSVEDVREAFVSHTLSEAWRPPSAESRKAAEDAFDAWLEAVRNEVHSAAFAEATAQLENDAK